jgi:hypothetical protein
MWIVELLYVKVLILVHNLDVMHQECNIGESILSTCMGFVDKTKDNHKARVVKIVHSSSEMVLRTTKHTVMYLGSSPSLDIIVQCPVV